MSNIDKEKIMKAVTDILVAVGEDPSRPGYVRGNVCRTSRGSKAAFKAV